MSFERSKEDLINDGNAKRSSYYIENYKTRTPRNYLRRYRNRLIREAISGYGDGGDVLDAGCGPAILYPEVLSRCERYVAVDLVEASLSEIERKNRGDEKLECVQGDLDTIEWDGAGFDVVICSGTLEYHELPVENLRKLIGFLNPGGVLVASLPAQTSPYRIWSEYVYRYLWYVKNLVYRRRFSRYKRRLFKAGKLKALCATEAGVSAVEIRRFGAKALLQPLDKMFGETDVRITKYCDQRKSWWMLPLYTEFLIVVKK